MRKFISKLNEKVEKVGLSVVAMAFATVPALAQDNIGADILSSATQGLSGLVTNLVNLIRVVMGLGAIVVLAMVIFKVFKGDREAAEKMAWWVGGLTIGFVLLTVVQNVVLKG